MSWMAGLRRRLHEALRPGRAAEELQDELRDHFEHELNRQFREGTPVDQAARLAALRVGNLEAARDSVRDERTGRAFADAIADLRLAARVARRNPGFTAAVVVSLALGVGGTTAVFSVVDAVLLRSLPYAEPERLAVVRIWWKDFSARLSPVDLNTLEDEAGSIADVGAFFTPDDGFAMSTGSGPELIEGAIVTERLPRVLGAAPIAGPGFSSVANKPEALIGETLWRARYDGSAAAIGRPIVLDGDAYTIVGVMPAGFNVPGQRDGAAWVKALRREPTRRGPFYFYTVARIAPGLGFDSAAAGLTSLVAPILRDRYGVEPAWRYGVQPLQTALVGDVGRTLWLLLGAMGLVLLIAIVNVTNLMLARGTVRARELAIRASLGAARERLARHLLAESVLLGILGGSLGLALAWVVLGLAWSGAVRVVPLMDSVRLDAGMAAFALACGIGAALVASLLPVIRSPWSGLAAGLREAGRASIGSRTHGRLRQGLVVAEIALTATVLTGAVLLGRSLMRLQAVEPGFDPDGVVSFRLTLPDDPYANEERLAAFVETLEQRLRAATGASHVAVSIALPPNLLVLTNNYTLEGADRGKQGISGVAEWIVVSPEYFRTMGIRMVRGQPFSAGDRAASPRVAIVNEAFARRHFRDEGILGARLKGGNWDAAAPWTTVVGVVADVPYGKGLWGGADATVYLPQAQNLWMQSFYVVLKTSGDPGQVLREAGHIVRSLDPNLPLRDPATMGGRLRASTIEPRLRSVVFTVIGSLALALAATGIYGVMAYQVNQRRRETAIRRALGATVRDVVGGVLRSGLRLTLAGLVLGAAGALFLTRSLSAILFQVPPSDPGSFGIVAILLAAAATVACGVPALKTARIDPAAVLRDDG